MIVSGAFRDRDYAVLGLARSGLASVRALVASGARVTAWDDRAEAREAGRAAGAAIEDFAASDLSRFDGIVVTPGLPLNRHPIAAAAKAAGVEIIGDVELFARARADLPPHRVVGITGTNGKSTTTALVHHILKVAGVPTSMGGNIGIPILEQEPLAPNESGVGVYVLELSSYQIDLTKSLDCEVAVLLNVTPDHLDRYDGFAAYAASKERLFAMQSSGAAIRGEDTPVLPFALGPSLQGPHNRQNADAAVRAARALGVDDAAIADALLGFTGLPHRMERIRELGGVAFVNDSKATNAEAAAPALAAFPKIRWILGGQAKSHALGDAARHLSHVVHAYTIGEAGPAFAALLRAEGIAVSESGTLENAVRESAKDSQKGETVLLSPMCASFDQFRDFEARGDAFRAIVESL